MQLVYDANEVQTYMRREEEMEGEKGGGRRKRDGRRKVVTIVTYCPLAEELDGTIWKSHDYRHPFPGASSCSGCGHVD